MDFIFDGIKINYTDCGSGTPVVFLHGWGADIHSFDFVRPHLDKFRMICIDLPGHGESQEPSRVYSINDFSSCVVSLLESIGVNRPVLVGHSNGGRVIIKMLSQGFCAEKVVLIDSAGVIPKRSFAYKLKVWKYKTAKKFIKLFYGKKADEKIYLAKDYYKGCMLTRDRFMADKADVMIAYCKKDTGGTAYTVRYFKKKYPLKEIIFL